MLQEFGCSRPQELLEEYVDSLPELFRWYEDNGRNYAWRSESDDWKILSVEILLQRTRADAVSRVYPKFIDRYPEPSTLHSADKEELKDLIEQLGFVNQRAKTLGEVADYIVVENGGQIPSNSEELKQCYRVGDYVAKALSIFARGNSTYLVDSNIARVIGRAFDIELGSQPHKNTRFKDLMKYLTPGHGSLTADYYYALIDLGALVCTPNIKSHQRCPLHLL